MYEEEKFGEKFERYQIYWDFTFVKCLYSLAYLWTPAETSMCDLYKWSYVAAEYNEVEDVTS